MEKDNLKERKFGLDNKGYENSKDVEDSEKGNPENHI